VRNAHRWVAGMPNASHHKNLANVESEGNMAINERGWKTGLLRLSVAGFVAWTAVVVVFGLKYNNDFGSIEFLTAWLGYPLVAFIGVFVAIRLSIWVYRGFLSK
jgi:hypothetical protein